MTFEEYYQKSEICGKHYPKCEKCPYREECRQEVEAMERLHWVSNYMTEGCCTDCPYVNECLDQKCLRDNERQGD